MNHEVTDTQGTQVRDVTMDFGYGHAFTEASPEAYERLILDVLLGDPPLFPRHEEVELSWRILDPIEEFWSAEGGPLEQAPLRGVKIWLVGNPKTLLLIKYIHHREEHRLRCFRKKKI